MARDRYLDRHEGLQVELEDIKAKLATRPRVVPLDIDRLFELRDVLGETTPDDAEWREIVAEVVDRIEIQGRDVIVNWRKEYRPLLTLTGTRKS